jgi:hypothetical protein
MKNGVGAKDWNGGAFGVAIGWFVFAITNFDPLKEENGRRSLALSNLPSFLLRLPKAKPTGVSGRHCDRRNPQEKCVNPPIAMPTHAIER